MVELIEKIKQKKMCYIDDIKCKIHRVCSIKELNMNFVERSLSEDSYKFICEINKIANQKNNHYTYKQLTITSKTGYIYILFWNLKKEFPVFISSRIYFTAEKYIDNDFCLKDDNMPDEINKILNEFNNKYIPDYVEKLKY